METFKIKGGFELKGEITPQGAKNEALQVICATILTDKIVTIHNIPDIIDVKRLIDLLSKLGVNIKKINTNSYSFQSDKLNLDYLESEEFKKDGKSLRGSIMIVGPLLSRFGKGYIPKPGGDKIGRRRLDTHFQGLVKLGGKFEYNKKDHFYTIKSDKLKGTYILLDEASVTGTANILMASALAEGTTTIYNAACEPYIQQLSKMLINMGANITGIGSNLLTIEGVNQLDGTEHTILPDMIETVALLRREFPKAIFTLPTLPRLQRRILKLCAEQPIRVVDADEHLANSLSQCDAVIAASGTVTLQAALYGAPGVACYKTSWFSGTLGRMIVDLRKVILPNAVLGLEVYPFLFQKQLRPDSLAKIVIATLNDPQAKITAHQRAKMLQVSLSGNAKNFDLWFGEKWLISF